MRFRWWVLFTMAVPLLICLGCNKRESGKAEPPPWNPENPVLAMVGDEKIDKIYFETSLNLLPPYHRARYAKAEDYPKFLDELILQEVYYQEGVRRLYNKIPKFTSLIEAARRKALIEYSKNKLVVKAPPITEEQKKAEFEKTKEKYKLANGTYRTYEEVAPLVEKELKSAVKKDLILKETEKLEGRFDVKYHLELLKPGNETSNKPVVESGVATWTYEEFAQAAQEMGLTRFLDNEKDRVRTLKRLIRDRLFHDNALAEKTDKEAVFAAQIRVLERFMLANYTKQKIIGEDIKADEQDARRFYTQHAKVYSDTAGNLLPFEKVKDKVFEAATAEERNRVLRDLAENLKRDRFLVVKYEDYCKKLWGL